jgi:hypothetical protein
MILQSRRAGVNQRLLVVQASRIRYSLISWIFAGIGKRLTKKGRAAAAL